MRKEVIIDIKTGNITGIGKEETIILKGDYLHEDSNYIDRPRIIIKDDNEEILEYEVKIGGYNLKLFLGHFCSNEKEDILIYGDTGGSGGYAIVIIYEYCDGALKEVFNADSFSEKYKCICKYLECYKIEVICTALERKYILDISNNKKEYLNEIYSKDGKIITNEDPTISYINKVDLINDLESGLLKLEAYARIIGVNNSNTLGALKSIISIKDEEIKVLEQGAVTFGESISSIHRANSKREEILEQLPEDSILINLNKFGGSNGLIINDIDGDGTCEILCGFKLKGNQYLASFREIDEKLKLLDTIAGEGYDISDLLIKELKFKNKNNILVGWRIGAIWSVLDILEFKENKFNKVLKGDKINYSKIEVVELDNKRSGTYDIALWKHESGEAYSVQLYSFRGDNLQKTFKYDREYFKKVCEYYKSLINRTRETPLYMYYLIDAEYRAGDKKEAMENLNKAMKHPNPYPSLEELKKLRKRINN